MISRLPATAPPGMPPATIFAIVVRIRGDPEHAVAPHPAPSGTGDHLVEDQDHAVLRRQVAQRLEKPVHQRNGRPRAAARLEDDRGHVALVNRSSSIPRSLSGTTATVPTTSSGMPGLVEASNGGFSP